MNVFHKLFQKKTTAKIIEQSISQFEALWNMNIDDIWKIEDKDDFVVAMHGWLCRKADYDNQIDTLSAAERTIYIIISLNNELQNGGFIQFLYNSSGQFAGEIKAALYSVGAEEASIICEKLLDMVSNPIPTDLEERRNWLDTCVCISEENEERIYALEQAFYDESDKLMPLCYQWIIEHKTSFS